MKTLFIHASPIALGLALSLMQRSNAKAELVRAHLEGIVNTSAIATQNGQTWSLSLVFDTSAPEVDFTADSPFFAEFFNTGAVKVLRSLDFVVGGNPDFAIHLVDPVPSVDSDVRIDIDNFESKAFFVDVDDAALLPSWNGLQLDNFLLGLEDLTPGGFADGTDHLPGPDPRITFAEFAGGFTQVRIKMGVVGQFIGTPTSFSLVSVPEPSAACLGAIGGLALLVRKWSPEHRPASIG